MIRVFLAVLASSMTVSVIHAHPTTQGEHTPTAPAVESAPAPEQVSPVLPSEVHMSQINEVLNAQPHDAGPTKDDWLRLAASEGSQLALATVLQNPKELLIRRQRALSGLSFFPTDKHKALVLGLLTADVSYRLKGSAAQAYGRMAGKEAVQPLAALLSAEKARLREAVVKALIALDDDDARDGLRRHLAQETKSYIKTMIQTALDEHSKPTEAGEAINP